MYIFMFYFTFYTCHNPEDDAVTKDWNNHDKAECNSPQDSDWSITETCAGYVGGTVKRAEKRIYQFDFMLKVETNIHRVTNQTWLMVTISEYW